MYKKDAYLWLDSFVKLNKKLIDSIIENGVKIEELILMSDKEIYDLKNMNLNIKENIVKYKSHSYLDNIKENLLKNNIGYVCFDDDEFPKNLKNIYNSPNILFYKGNINIVNKGINFSVVGARKATNYGINCSKYISKELSKNKINIVSGLAIGIDSYAHIGSIEGGGKTIAVLGSSVDNILPRKNIELSNKILENDGLILSEYNINSNVYKSNYVERNRIISGMSDGVLVIEAAKKSGALITVEFALEQGRDVFAVPGNINSPMSEGCNKIIKEGAKLVEKIEDILQEYKIVNIENKENLKKYANINLNERSKAILNAINNKGILHIDEICDNTSMDIKYINSILNELVLKDILVEMKNKTYSLNL